MTAEKTPPTNKTTYVTGESTEPNPDDDEITANIKRAQRDSLVSLNRQIAERDAYVAAQQPNKRVWPGSIADLVRLIEGLTNEGLWPERRKWQQAADKLLDRKGKPITAKQLTRSAADRNFRRDMPTRSELRQLLLDLNR